uniref:L,D-TPase catalytic domain-containing protein n=1 Tax=Magnetococcus massalia (strain MO-1) TaxID=451514 RepID=A0A1S7LJ99_MAGMO|nr:conserved protein of unknown function [ Include ErfK/YbiS/YcfS/YnhG conserved domain] [Candidatus Magnetococcus massalia]
MAELSAMGEVVNRVANIGMRSYQWLRLATAMVLALGCFTLPAPVHAVESKPSLLPDQNVQMASYERLFIQGMDALANGEMAMALSSFRALTEKKPDFRLAQLIYSDLLMAQANPIQKFGVLSKSKNESIKKLQVEAKARLMHQVKRLSKQRLPASLLRLSKRHTHAIAVDLERSRLFLFDNRGGVPKLTSDYYISSGKKGAVKLKQGDKKTPVGLYYVTKYIPGEKLPDLYGSGALPLNYPNEWDRRHKRTGYGIWLHGTQSSTYSRPPKASDGCVALTNLDFEKLEESTGIGTPVLISKQLDWISPNAWKDSQRTFLQKVYDWYEDLQSGQPERALRHYAKSFRNQKKGYRAWRKHVTRLVKGWDKRQFILTDPSIFQYPGEESMVVVTFTQRHPEDTPGIWRLRRQYWKLEPAEARWQIVYEDIG